MASPGPQYAHVASTNTLLQGLAVVVVTSVCTALLQVLGAGHFSWSTVGITVGTAALTAVASYLQHAYIEPFMRMRGIVNDGSAAQGPE